MEVFGRISRLLALEESPTVPEALESNVEFVKFLNSIAVAVESKQEQVVGFERTLAEARLRQLNLGIISRKATFLPL